MKDIAMFVHFLLSSNLNLIDTILHFIPVEPLILNNLIAIYEDPGPGFIALENIGMFMSGNESQTENFLQKIENPHKYVITNCLMPFIKNTEEQKEVFNSM
jgi:hypothetical protein